MLKSIFRDQRNRDANQHHYEGLKQFIENETNLGK